ncbi:hypothetical protein [Aphanizomenon flos-aquae]|jgi:CDP-paratose 2-epimerase|nr:hypothetical protein [Aphanizomenon flos-aquae]
MREHYPHWDITISLEETIKQISRWALKIVVGAREQGTLNWEQEESFE